VLREHALVESAISSNRIEGVEVDRSRIGTLVFGKPALRDRGEEEVRGYRDALRLIHERAANLPISETTVRRLHKLSRGGAWDAGDYKNRDIDIVQTYPDGRRRVRFTPVSAKRTPRAMAELMALWQRGMREQWVHPVVLAAALTLDFLCIHPFRDGDGRVSRLLFLLACYHCGRIGPLHQPGASHRGEQGPLLRSAGTIVTGLARRPARSLARHQFSLVYPR
jgi:Fic family protein